MVGLDKELPVLVRGVRGVVCARHAIQHCRGGCAVTLLDGVPFVLHHVSGFHSSLELRHQSQVAPVPAGGVVLLSREAVRSSNVPGLLKLQHRLAQAGCCRRSLTPAPEELAATNQVPLHLTHPRSSSRNACDCGLELALQPCGPLLPVHERLVRRRHTRGVFLHAAQQLPADHSRGRLEGRAQGGGAGGHGGAVLQRREGVAAGVRIGLQLGLVHPLQAGQVPLPRVLHALEPDQVLDLLLGRCLNLLPLPKCLAMRTHELHELLTSLHGRVGGVPAGGHVCCGLECIFEPISINLRLQRFQHLRLRVLSLGCARCEAGGGLPHPLVQRHQNAGLQERVQHLEHLHAQLLIRVHVRHVHARPLPARHLSFSHASSTLHLLGEIVLGRWMIEA
mmetsp:Transcript_11724/g.22283  ORF Transcript_11724/g.22283 Transcript_11724/m.22283 type:complete len:393 (-) Transcript_11724:244-1422(-)